LFHLLLFGNDTFGILIESLSPGELYGISPRKSKHALGIAIHDAVGSLLNGSLQVTLGIFLSSFRGKVPGGAETLVDEIIWSGIGVGR
jgi:hypothetical protein